MFGNGNSSLISHIGNKSFSQDLKLSEALVVPNIIKNLISISKLTSDSPVDVLFSNRATKEIIARGKFENEL